MGVRSKSFETPDEAMAFEHGRAQMIKMGESTVGRFTFEPGWRWSECIKPIAKTDSCQVHHVGYVVTGRLHVLGDDGSEAEFAPGDAYEVLPGHDGWVVGEETYTSVEFLGSVS
jgi:hypothetical protein